MIVQPYINFIQPDAGGNVKPVSKGKIYIGEEGLDPKNGGNPIYYRDNQGVEKEISNPIYLNMTGVAVAGSNDSTIISPYTKKPISILIEDRNGNEIYSELFDVNNFANEKYVDDAIANQKVKAEGYNTERSLPDRFSDSINIRDLDGYVQGSDVTSILNTNLVKGGRAIHLTGGEFTISGRLDVKCGLIIESDAKLKQTNANSDTFMIYSSGFVDGGGCIDVSGINYTGSLIRYDTELNGNYDISSGYSNPLSAKCGARDLTIITDFNGSGTGITLRTHDTGDGSNSYISWLWHNNLRVVGKFAVGIKFERFPTNSWINGNIFDGVIIDKSIKKIVGCDANTYNTFNNIITQPQGSDLPSGNESTVELDAGYFQGYLWDGDKAVINGGHDNLQRIEPHFLFYGDQKFGLINAVRGITDSPYFSRRGLDETLFGMKTLVANINGGASGQVGRGMFEYSRTFGETWNTFKNSVDIDHSSEAVFKDDLGINGLGYDRHTYASGAMTLPCQHLGIGRSGGASGRVGDWGRLWCNRAGVLNPKAPFQAHIMVSPATAGGKYRIGLGAQDHVSSKEISDGVYIEWDTTDGTDNVTAVMYSGGLVRQTVPIQTASLASGNFLSIYFLGLGSEIKVAWAYGSSASSPDLTVDYMNVLTNGNVDGARFNQAVLLTTLPSLLLAPFFQMENVDNGVPQLHISSVECRGHRTLSTM